MTTWTSLCYHSVSLCYLHRVHTHARTHARTHTHTHLFNGPFSRTTRVGQYQKSKTNLDFTEARDSEWQWHQLGHMHVCTSLQTENHAITPPLSFLQAGCPSCRPTNSVKALKAHRVNGWNSHKYNKIAVVLSQSTMQQTTKTVLWGRCFSACPQLVHLHFHLTTVPTQFRITSE